MTSTLATPRALLDGVIDGQRVVSVFQPIVDLDTGHVVAFEALARGPAGTALESPLALIDAARQAGRLVELDWLCRLSALRGAVAAGLPEEVMLFLNVEPSTLSSPAPSRLAAEFDDLAGAVRVMVELTERSLVDDPERLLELVGHAHERGWGIAVDDVGAQPESLTLMPFLDPDVIKLDLRLVQDLSAPAAAGVALAARAEAERTGASILAEGIETQEHVDIARVLGARYGQGWFLGRPGPLPQSFARHPHGLRLLPSAPVTPGTPYEIVSATRATRPARKRHLLAISHQLEQSARSLGAGSVLLSCFQESRHFTAATRRRYEELGQVVAFTAALAVGLADLDLPGVRGADLGRVSPLRGEWNVVVVGPHFSAALVARDRGDAGLEADRTFDYAITHDRGLVLACARSLLRTVHDGGA